MTLGNLVAIRQKDMKRLLAYSTVAHAGYVLIGLLSFSPSGYASTIFYAFAYLVMKFTCFLVLVKVAAVGSDLQIAQLAGLHRRSPLLAMALMDRRVRPCRDSTDRRFYGEVPLVHCSY